MNRRFPLLTLAFLTPLLAFAATEPTAGDTRAVIESALGAPTIRRRLTDGTVLVKYPRGTVTYRDDRAIALNLIPAAEWRARIEAEQKARVEAEARRIADKVALDELLVSKSYRHLSPSGKIAEIDALRARHPAADTDALRADLLATLIRENAAEARLRSVENELAATRRQVETLRNTPPPEPIVVEKTKIVEVPVETQPVYGSSVVYFHGPGGHRHGGDSRRDPLNNTPTVGTPGQAIPYNRISEYLITGPKPPSNIIPNNPISGYLIGANPVPAKPTETKPTDKTDKKRKTD